MDLNFAEAATEVLKAAAVGTPLVYFGWKAFKAVGDAKVDEKPQVPSSRLGSVLKFPIRKSGLD